MSVLTVFLAAFGLQVGVESLLLALNLHRAARSRGVPPALAGVLDEATADRSRAYVLAHGRAAGVEGLLAAAATLAVLLLGALPWLDRTLGSLGLAGPHLFVGFLGALAAASGIFSLPFAVHRTFVIEQRFGFNRTTPRLWIADRLKGLALEIALGLPVLYAVYGFMRWTGEGWWLWVFAFLAAVQLFMNWIWPAFIAPLFNRFEPLPEGPLRARLEALASEAGFRNRGLFVMDASRRSGHSNAYFHGLFRPRIVLYDTLVEGMDVNETASVLAHEIGHFRMRHVHRRLAVSMLTLFLTLFVASRLLPWAPLHQAFGFAAPTLHGGLGLLALGGGAFLFWLTPLAARVSRRHEYEADRYAVRLARAPAALRSALLRLAGENLSNPAPHPWYAAWHYSHPTLPERLARIEVEAAALATASWNLRPAR